MHPLVGSTVKFNRAVVTKPSILVPKQDGEEAYQTETETGHEIHQATVIACYDPLDSDNPKVTLAFLHPDRLDRLSTVDWRDAFDQAHDVPYSSDAPAGSSFWAWEDTCLTAPTTETGIAVCESTLPTSEPANGVPEEPATEEGPTAEQVPAPEPITDASVFADPVASETPNLEPEISN